MSINYTLFCLLIVLALPKTYGLTGLDTMENVTISQYSCLKKQFAIFHCFYEGQVVQTCAQSVNVGWSVLLVEVGVYMTPCVNSTCQDPVSQMKSLITYIYQNKLHVSHLWIEVTGNWTTSNTNNQQLLLKLFLTANAEGMQIGFLTSKNDWYGIMGQNYQFPYSSYLWYHQYDNIPNFNDFVPFGGWITPHMKRYTKNLTSCGVYYSVDFRLNNSQTSGSTREA